MAYATLQDYKAWRGTADGFDDARIQDALDVASADVDEWCQRSFADSGSATPKTYRQVRSGLLLVDDFSTTTGLVVSDNGTTLTIGSDFYAEQERSGVFYRLRFSPYRWSLASWEPLVSVTARWGWASVPDPVKRATLHMAADLLQGTQNTYGMVGFEAGAVLRARRNTVAEALLASFRRGDRTAL